MNSTLVGTLVFACLAAAMLLGMALRRLLPAHHLSGDSKDTVKVAMGLVATMAALLLGLLVSSAKGSYDTIRGEVIQLAAKISFLDRALEVYGPEAADLRAQLRRIVGQVTHQLWPDQASSSNVDLQSGDAFFNGLQQLTPKDDAQRAAKAQALSIAVDLAQLRSLLVAQSISSISLTLLIVVVCWLAMIFLSFSLLAPSNATVVIALLVSALSVTAAIFLVLELDRPFTGLISISSEHVQHALRQVAQ